MLALAVTLASLLACLTLIFTLSESGLQALLALVVTVCTRTVSETLAHQADLGRLLVFVPLAVGVTLATSEAVRLLYSTWRWTTALSSWRRAPTRRLARLAHKCGFRQNVILIQTDHQLAFTQGLLKPRVWLSTGLIRALSDDELEAVLRHEAHHREKYDPLKILLAQCLGRALFFVPVARDLCETYAVAREIAADARATQAMDSALPLTRALRKMIAGHLAPILYAPLVGDARVTEARLLTLLDPAHPLPLVPMRRLGLSLVWLMFFLIVRLAPTAGHLPTYSECATSMTARLLGWWL